MNEFLTILIPILSLSTVIIIAIVNYKKDDTKERNEKCDRHKKEFELDINKNVTELRREINDVRKKAQDNQSDIVDLKVVNAQILEQLKSLNDNVQILLKKEN